MCDNSLEFICGDTRDDFCKSEGSVIDQVAKRLGYMESNTPLKTVKVVYSPE